MDKRDAPAIEIVEAGVAPDYVGPIVPNDVRINGQSILVSSDDPVSIDAIDMHSRDVVRVTLTALARRVEVKSEVL
jgi:hypothetical protein